MTREDIGGYLGLAPKTISRVLSRFQRERLIGVSLREIDLKNAASLRGGTWSDSHAWWQVEAPPHPVPSSTG